MSKKPNEFIEYASDFFFHEARLDNPSIYESAKKFFERAKELETFCRETVDPSVKVRMDWEWNIKRQRWYPYIECTWLGSNFNTLRLEIDYCYRFFYGEDKAFNNACIANAISSLISIR